MSHFKSFIFLVLGCILVTVLLAACDDQAPTSISSNSNTAASAPTLTPGNLNTAIAQVHNSSACSLLSTFEVAILLGDGNRQQSRTDNACTYSSTDDRATVQLSLNSSPDEFTSKKSQINTAPTSSTNSQNAPAQTLQGIGDDAFWSGNTLYILANNKVLSLSANGAGLKNPTSLFANLQVLGKKAISRLRLSQGVTPTPSS